MYLRFFLLVAFTSFTSCEVRPDMKNVTIGSFELLVPKNWQIERRTGSDFTIYLLTTELDTATIYLGYAPDYPKMQEPLFQDVRLKNYLDSSGIEYDERLMFVDERVTDRNRVQKFNYEYRQVNDYWVRIITKPKGGFFRIYIDSLGYDGFHKLSFDLICENIDEFTKDKLLEALFTIKDSTGKP